MWLFWFFNALMHHSSPCIRIITLLLQRAALPFITLLVFGWPGTWKWLGKCSMLQHFWSWHGEITQETWRASKAPLPLLVALMSCPGWPPPGREKPSCSKGMGFGLSSAPASWNFRKITCSIGISYCLGTGLHLRVCRARFYIKTHLLFINRSWFLGESQS